MKRPGIGNSHGSGPTAAIGALALAALAACQPAWAGAFTGGSLVAYRVVNAGGSGNGGALAVVLDEYLPDGTYKQSIELSNAANSIPNPLTASKTGSEGLLTRSAAGTCLVVPGYATGVGSTSPSGAAATAVQRAVTAVAADGSTSRTTLGTAAISSQNIRGAASNDAACQTIWATGATSGVWYTNASGTSTGLDTADNVHGITVVNSALVVGSNKDTLRKFGAALPTASDTLSRLPGLGSTSSTFRGIAALHLGGGGAPAGANTLYAADNNNGSLYKFSFDGTNWSAKGSLALGAIHGLVAIDTGDGNVMLLATVNDGKLYRLFDRSGYGATLSGAFQTITPGGGMAGPGDQFYGLAWAPEASPPASPPAAPASVTPAASGNGASPTWPAVTGAAYYVVEVSSGADFTAGVDDTKTVITTATSATVNSLSVGQHMLRVRAVNSAGGSTSTVSGAFISAAPPTTPWPAVTAFSGVIGDPTDPLATSGLAFTVSDPSDAAGSLTVTATSSNAAVVPNNSTNLSVANAGGNVTLKVMPTGVGYADITVTITNTGGASVTRTIKYAASAHTAASAGTRWFAGRSDGSTVIVRDGGGTLLVGDDEGVKLPAGNLTVGNSAAVPDGNAFFGYAATRSGLLIAPLLVDSGLNVNSGTCPAGTTGIVSCKADGEVDTEASFAIGNRVYATGSHSNSKSGNSRADRWRFFAADVGGTGSTTTLAVQGYYQWLREDLRTWDANSAHGLGANYFQISDSSAGGANKDPENNNLSGFSIEGMSTSPDDSAAWFGFRAPLVNAPGTAPVAAGDPTNRTHALIVPVKNYAALATAASGGAQGTAQFGTPIRLDLGGRGIREIRKNGSNEYLIIAGSAQGAGKSFVFYTWDGSVNASGLAINLRLRDTDLSAFTKPATECAAEGIGTLPAHLAAGGSVDVISDCGDADFYNDGTAAKDLPYAAWKKFRADVVTLNALPALALATGTPTLTTLPFTATASAAGTLYAVALPAGAAAPSWEQVVAGTDSTGSAPAWKSGAVSVTTAAQSLTATGLAAGTYDVYAVAVTSTGYTSVLGQLAGFATAMPTPQTIAFGALGSQVLGTAPFTVSATGGGSGNPVVFSSTTTGVCLTGGTNGTTVTLVTTGTCTLQATQAGGAGFAAATPVTQGFTVTPPSVYPGGGTALPGTGGVSGSVAGGGTWRFASNSQGFQPAAGLPGMPSGYTFPYGMFSFVLINGTAGTSATVSLNLPQAAPPGTVLWKYGRQAPGAAKAWYQITPTFSGDRKTASFTVTDGAGATTGDDDQVANGVIIDPVLFAAPLGGGGGAAAIPTLSDAGRWLLALALAGLAALRMRARRRA